MIHLILSPLPFPRVLDSRYSPVGVEECALASVVLGKQGSGPEKNILCWFA